MSVANLLPPPLFIGGSDGGELYHLGSTLRCPAGMQEQVLRRQLTALIKGIPWRWLPVRPEELSPWMEWIVGSVRL